MAKLSECAKTGFFGARRKRLLGQGLVEYLVLVAVIGVATIGVASYLQKALKNQYVNTIHALNGDGNETEKIQQSELQVHLQRRDLGNFMAGADTQNDKKYQEKDRQRANGNSGGQN